MILDDYILPACMAIAGLSAVALWLLSRPASWLSRLVDRCETVGGAQ